MAQTARSLHCRDSVRLQSYFHRPDEPVSTPARDPQLPSGLTHQRSATLACARMQDQIESGVFACLRAA